MITPFQMYVLVKLTDFVAFALILGLCIILGGLIYILNKFSKDDASKLCYKDFRLMFVGVLLVLTAFVLPTTKQAATIIVLPKIINNQGVQALPEKVLKLATDWLEEVASGKNDEQGRMSAAKGEE